MGAIVRSRTENRQVSFLTNRHVAVDLDYPNQKMFHPLPPSLGPGVYLGAVERATSFITDELWHGIFAGTNPAAAQDQRNAIDYTIGESPHPERVPPKDEENFEPLNLNIQPVLVDGETQHPSFINRHFHIDGIETSPKVEHQFIPSFTGKSPMHQNNKQENLESRGIIMEAIL